MAYITKQTISENIGCLYLVNLNAWCIGSMAGYIWKYKH